MRTLVHDSMHKEKGQLLGFGLRGYQTPRQIREALAADEAQAREKLKSIQQGVSGQ